MMGRVLDELPDGARVLNLAPGPALEVQRLFAARPDKHLHVDLVDHDPLTVDYLRRQLLRPHVRVLGGNAFRIMAGDLRVTSTDTHPPKRVSLTGGYDLIYSMGLLDYIPDDTVSTRGAAQLTPVLFLAAEVGRHPDDRQLPDAHPDVRSPGARSRHAGAVLQLVPALPLSAGRSPR